MTQPQVSRRTKVTVGLIALGLVALSAVLWLAGWNPTEDNGSGDVSLSGCSYDGFANRTTVTVTNSGNETASYDVTVEFDSPTGVRLGTDDVFINDLSSHQTAERDAVAVGSAQATSCVVRGVTRS